MNHFSRVLMDWYECHGRTLPWRQTKDPYLIWISEIILQQTRVAQGYQYYCNFVNRFPTLSSLAMADEDEVLRFWQGLGYYSRARNLHQAAQSIHGAFPTSYKDILALKGVGPYTAAAISSIAYDLPYAVVDGNVYRVLARYFGVDIPIDTNEGQKHFAALAQSLLPKVSPSKYNQAIMDFGALQCVPHSPDCSACPLLSTCSAFREQNIDMLPVKTQKVKIKTRHLHYLYIHDQHKFIIQKREKNDIWKGLYELPLIETEKQTSESLMLRTPSWLDLNLAFPIKSVVLKQRVRHILTHRVIELKFYEVICSDFEQIDSRYQSIGFKEWSHFAMPQPIYNFLESQMQNF